MTTTSSLANTTAEPSRQVRRARARQAARAAAASTPETEVQAWLKDMNARLDVIFAHPEQNLGEIEEQLARSVKEPLRLLAQRAAQVKANAVACQCPDCHGQLTQQRWLGRKAPASPYVQEISALLVSKLPVEQAVLVAERLGLDLSRCGLHLGADPAGCQHRRSRAALPTLHAGHRD